ncbi:2Fe-2S iron-sulfur cluster-binding protein [Streptomyces omiyaensis]|uniref:2Fe-2S iron-sulfur cluster-binding protein n=1 Tax=Streptomyces omiyaensis TaxID=68247 RepID=UPI0036FF7D24
MNTGNNEPNETAAPAAPGGWEPIPQSEGYDEGATAFVHLPPEFMLDGVPLEAPGHGYTPPMIVPLQPLAQPVAADPEAAGTWPGHLAAEPEHHGEGVEFFALEPEHGFGTGPEPLPHGYGDETAGAPVARPYGGNDPHATAEWHFGATGQWEVPEAPEARLAPEAPLVPEAPLAPEAYEVPGRLADFPAAPAGEAPAPASYEQAPPTLPGGAPAPWAVPDAVGEPVAAEEPEPVGEPAAGPAEEPVGESGAEAPADAGPEPEPEPGPVADPGHAATAAAVPDAPAPSYTSVDSDEHPHTSYVLRVNGADRPVTDSWIGESLLYVLRERLGLAGAKDGCSQGECGACNVQVDGRLVASCLVPAATAAGSEVRTVEGLAADGEPSDVQRALTRCGTVQCGFCIPGMCMTVHDLLEGNHAPTELETRQALAGNLCRCSGYKGVLQAVEDVVAERAAAAADHAAAGEDDATGRIPHQLPHPTHDSPHQHDGGRA